VSRHRNADMDRARDELMSQAMRCGVLRATPEQQEEWLTDTMDYLLEQFPSLSSEELGELKEIGHRFCQPVIPHGKGNTAQTVHGQDESSSTEPAEEEATP
jgi:hypothetical protein